jgi:acetoin utilization deacetylase AcuC-like enzyme
MKVQDSKTKIPIVYHEGYSTDFPIEHRFVMLKFSMLVDVLQKEEILTDKNIYVPELISRVELLLAHEESYVDRVLNGSLSKEELREMGLPYSPGLIERVLWEVSGTILTGELALKNGIACNAGGGTHHAHPGKASGFCIFNDAATAIRVLQYKNKIKTALIIDLDVHQGDGNNAFFNEDNSVYVFSMHGEKNFPLRKVKGDLDIALPDEIGDLEYMNILKESLPEILDKFSPDLVFYDAGIDPFEGDTLGKLSLSEQGLLERDIYVLTTLRNHSLPVATVIGGGYDKDHYALANRHGIIFRAAERVFGDLHKSDYLIKI